MSESKSWFVKSVLKNNNNYFQMVNFNNQLKWSSNIKILNPSQFHQWTQKKYYYVCNSVLAIEI